MYYTYNRSRKTKYLIIKIKYNHLKNSKIKRNIKLCSSDLRQTRTQSAYKILSSTRV